MTTSLPVLSRHTPLMWIGVPGGLGLAVGGAVGAVRGDAVSVIATAGLFAALSIAGAIDLHERRIPNAITYPGIVLALLLAAVYGVVLESIGGFALAGGVMTLSWFVSGGQIGIGDVKLSAFAGAVLGVEGGLIFLLAGAGIGGLVALAIFIRDRDRRATFAYGPVLAAGAAISTAMFGVLIAR